MLKPNGYHSPEVAAAIRRLLDSFIPDDEPRLPKELVRKIQRLAGQILQLADEIETAQIYDRQRGAGRQHIRNCGEHNGAEGTPDFLKEFVRISGGNIDRIRQQARLGKLHLTKSEAEAYRKRKAERKTYSKASAGRSAVKRDLPKIGFNCRHCGYSAKIPADASECPGCARDISGLR